MAKPLFRLVDGYVEICGRGLPRRQDPLALSIAKWEFIVAEMESGKVVEGDGGVHTCALCRKHNKAKDDDCIACPVAINTGQQYCAGSPYEKWEKDRSLENAKAELAFLRTLTP